MLTSCKYCISSYAGCIACRHGESQALYYASHNNNMYVYNTQLLNDMSGIYWKYSRDYFYISHLSVGNLKCYWSTWPSCCFARRSHETGWKIRENELSVCIHKRDSILYSLFRSSQLRMINAIKWYQYICWWCYLMRALNDRRILLSMCHESREWEYVYSKHQVSITENIFLMRYC